MKNFLSRKKRILSMVVALCCLLSISNIFATENKGKRITDTVGNVVILPEKIERIAIVPIPWSSIVYTLEGNGKRIVGMHPSAKKSYDKEIFHKLAPELKNVNTSFVDSDFNMNMEEVMKLKPDVVIVWDYQKKEIKQLKSMGITPIALKYGTLDDLQDGIEVLGTVLGKEKKAQELIQYHQEAEKYFETKKEAIKKSSKPKILYLRDENLKVAAKRSANKIYISMAGGENVANGVFGQWTNVTMEQIMQWNPDIIIMSNFSDFMPDDLYTNKFKGQDWSKITAVKNKAVYKAPAGIYRWDAPNGETPLMIKWLGQTIQPKIFSDVDMSKEIKTFYKKFYNYDIKQEEINKILKKGN